MDLDYFELLPIGRLMRSRSGDVYEKDSSNSIARLKFVEGFYLRVSRSSIPVTYENLADIDLSLCI